MPIELSLRKRKEDLPLLCEFIIEKHAQNYIRKSRDISSGHAPYQKYNWPGNIRELDNVIERAIILTEDEIIGVEDLHIFEARAPLEKLERVGKRLHRRGFRIHWRRHRKPPMS